VITSSDAAKPAIPGLADPPTPTSTSPQPQLHPNPETFLRRDSNHNFKTGLAVITDFGPGLSGALSENSQAVSPASGNSYLIFFPACPLLGNSGPPVKVSDQHRC